MKPHRPFHVLRPLRALASVALAVLAASCSGEPPPPSLRIVMYQVDYAEKEIGKVIANPKDLDAVAERAREIATLTQDTAFERYKAKPVYPLPPAQHAIFDQMHADLRTHAEALELAASSGDAGEAGAAYAVLHGSCEACHVLFRPGL